MIKTGFAQFGHTLPLIVFLLFMSCADDGEQGDPGPAGPQGPVGATGPQGPKGDTGNADIIYSDWFALSARSGKTAHYINSTTTGLLYEFDVPQITQEILDKGLVIVFFRYEGAVRTLPVIDYAGFGIDMELLYITLSKLHILIHRDGVQYGVDSAIIVEEPELFRYVIIPGGNPLSGSERIATPVDYRDYKALKTYYNIPD